MKFSLVMATIGRTKEVEMFMDSLSKQTYQNYELIIVDQNPTPILNPLIEKYITLFPIIHIFSSEQGLSLARNKGIQHATGEVISFPDDDCLYPPSLLEDVVKQFQKHKETTALSTCWHDIQSGEKLRNFGNKEEWINQITIWTQVSSITLFIKSETFKEIGLFDEQLGIGPNSIWKGAEDKDLPIRIIREGKKIRYTPSLYVLHAAPTLYPSTIEERFNLLEKSFLYSAASGFVMRKHNYPIHLKVASIIVILAKLLFNFIRFDKLGCQIRWASLKGRIYGFVNTPEKGVIG